MLKKIIRLSFYLFKQKWVRIAPVALTLALILNFIPVGQPFHNAMKLLSRSGLGHLPASSALPIAQFTYRGEAAPLFGPDMVRATGGLTVTKIASPAYPLSVDQGGIISYTLVVTNNTGVVLTNVVVTDTVPFNTECDSITEPNGDWVTSLDVCRDNDLAFWVKDLGVFSDTTSVALEYAVKVGAPLPYPTTISTEDFRVSVFGGFSDYQTTVITTPVNSPGWQIQKIMSPPLTTIKANSFVTYTIIVTNVGSLSTSLTIPYQIFDAIPANTTFISNTNTNPDGGSFDGANLTWQMSAPRLAPGEDTQVQFSVQVDNGLPNGTVISNDTYRVSGGGAAGVVSGLESITVTAVTPPDLGVSKSDSSGGSPVRAGQLLTYTLAYTNLGGEVIPSLRITDTLPASVTLDSLDPGGATEVSSSSPVFTRANLGIGQSDLITIVVRLNNSPWPPTGADFVNAVIASMNVTDDNPANNTAILTTTGQPDLPATLTLNAPAQAFVGDNTPITATLTDQYGNPVLDGTAVNFVIDPPGSVIPPGATTAGGQATATIDASIPATVIVTATHNTLSDNASVEFIAPTLRKQASAGTVRAGESVTYTIIYNNDSGPLTNLRITDTLPAKMATLEAVDDGGMTVVISNTSTVVLAQASVASGEVLTVTITGRVVNSPWPSSGEAVTNLVSASNDTNPDPVTDTVTIQGQPNAPANIALQAAPTNLLAGGTAMLTATVTDQYGNRVLDGLTVSFQSSLAGSSVTPGGSTQNGAVTGTVTASISGTTTISATANSLVDTVDVTFFTVDPTGGNIYLPVVLK
jgi:uncharacterized repeat protein (TIGR01451 family)